MGSVGIWIGKGGYGLLFYENLSVQTDTPFSMEVEKGDRGMGEVADPHIL